jgi:hypothetical protein
MGKSYAHIIRAVALAAAILGLLLTTPSIEARTHKKTPHRKKMKIVFDGSTPAPQGELGDEIAPRATDHKFAESGGVVRLRGGSVDELWKKSKSAKNVKAVAAEEENPDLMDPALSADANADFDAPASKRSSKPTILATGSSVDESALGAFKKSKAKHQSKAKLVATLPKASQKITHNVRSSVEIPVVTVSNQTRPAPVEDTLDFDNAPAPHKVVSVAQPVRAARAQVEVERPTPPQSKIYLRHVQPVVRSRTRVVADSPSDFKFNFAFENTTSMGRKVELETPGGRNYMMKNEVFLGTDHSSGWGAKLAVNYINTSNDDTTKDIREMGDPSIIIAHPSLYRSVDIDVYGQGRYYLPVAAHSKKVGLQHLAYSLFARVQLVAGLDLHNELTGRYYVQTTYADSDAFALIEDHTEVAKRFDFFRLGLGQRTQIESHQVIEPGTSFELYPFAELLAISNTVIQAKLYVPLFGNGIINGAPGSPSGPSGSGFSNVQAEFSARLSW